jgi:hypothetical protein
MKENLRMGTRDHDEPPSEAWLPEIRSDRTQVGPQRRNA